MSEGELTDEEMSPPTPIGVTRGVRDNWLSPAYGNFLFVTYIRSRVCDLREFVASWRAHIAELLIRQDGSTVGVEILASKTNTSGDRGNYLLLLQFDGLVHWHWSEHEHNQRLLLPVDEGDGGGADEKAAAWFNIRAIRRPDANIRSILIRTQDFILKDDEVIGERVDPDKMRYTKCYCGEPLSIDMFATRFDRLRQSWRWHKDCAWSCLVCNEFKIF